jgi:hypothetical protein
VALSEHSILKHMVQTCFSRPLQTAVQAVLQVLQLEHPSPPAPACNNRMSPLKSHAPALAAPSESCSTICKLQQPMFVAITLPQIVHHEDLDQTNRVGKPFKQPWA